MFTKHVQRLQLVHDNIQRKANTVLNSDIALCRQLSSATTTPITGQHLCGRKQKLHALLHVKDELTDWSAAFALRMQKSKPVIFQAPLLLSMTDSGDRLECTNFTLLCRNARPSHSYSRKDRLCDVAKFAMQRRAAHILHTKSSIHVLIQNKTT